MRTNPLKASKIKCHSALFRVASSSYELDNIKGVDVKIPSKPCTFGTHFFSQEDITINLYPSCVFFAAIFTWPRFS